MIIKLLSDSKQIMWDEEEDLTKYKAHALIDEKEYYIFSIESPRGSEIWLKDSLSNREINTGDLFDMVYSFWRRSSVFKDYGKAGEVLLFDGNGIFNIIYFNANDVLTYDEKFNDFKILAKFIEADINLIKYLSEYLNKKEFLEVDLDLWKLVEIPEFLHNLFAKLRGKLELNFLKILTDNDAQFLSKHIGELELMNLVNISDISADYLSQHIGNLDLIRLESVTDITADHLSKHAGLLNLKNLENISKEGITYLLNHRGAIICKSKLYNAYRERYSSVVNYEKILFNDNDLSFIYLNIAPVNGICVDFIKNIDSSLDVVLDKRNTIPITDFLQALDLSSADILNLFKIHYSKIKNTKESLSQALGKRFFENVYRCWTEDFVDEETGDVVSIERNELLFNVNEVISTSAIEVISELQNETIYVLETISKQSEILFNSMLKGNAQNNIEAIQKLYRLINLEDPANDEISKEFAERFASGATINLGSEARKSLNNLLNISETRGDGLYKSDYIEIVKYLISN